MVDLILSYAVGVVILMGAVGYMYIISKSIWRRWG